jgi:hypothetical protein
MYPRKPDENTKLSTSNPNINMNMPTSTPIRERRTKVVIKNANDTMDIPNKKNVRNMTYENHVQLEIMNKPAIECTIKLEFLKALKPKASPNIVVESAPNRINRIFEKNWLSQYTQG